MVYQRAIPQVGGLELNKTVSLGRGSSVVSVSDIESGSTFIVSLLVWAGSNPTGYMYQPTMTNCELLNSYTSGNQTQYITNYQMAEYVYICKANSSSIQVQINYNSSYIYLNSTMIAYKSV